MRFTRTKLKRAPCSNNINRKYRSFKHTGNKTNVPEDLKTPDICALRYIFFKYNLLLFTKYKQKIAHKVEQTKCNIRPLVLLGRLLLRFLWAWFGTYGSMNLLVHLFEIISLKTPLNVPTKVRQIFLRFIFDQSLTTHNFNILEMDNRKTPEPIKDEPH